MPINENGSIICPYCFKKFDDKDVIFRSNHSLTQYDIDNSSLSREEKEIRKLFLRFDDYNGDIMDFPTDLKIDKKLVEFWDKKGGADGYIHADPNWYKPHIDPNSDNFSKMTKPIGEDRFKRDVDGFIVRVRDIFENHVDGNMARLCPYCHNCLPLKDYGKYKPVFIGIVGSTSAGKTVYLNQLLQRFATLMNGSGYDMGTAALGGLGNIENGKPLPASTDTKIMRRPMAINMVKRNNPSESRTLVFYDIAGEQCVEDVDIHGAVRTDSLVAEYIKYCDGLLFLADPSQLPTLGVAQRKAEVDINDVVNRLNMLKSGTIKNVSNTPLAIVITKCDDSSPHAALSRLYEVVKEAASQAGKGFNREAFLPVNKAVKQIFEDEGKDVLFNVFNIHAFFAASALTCGVENRLSLHETEFVLDEENKAKYDRLKKFINTWNQRKVENRRYIEYAQVSEDKEHIGIGIRDNKGDFITFNVNQDICRKVQREKIEVRKKEVEITEEDIEKSVKAVIEKSNSGETITEIQVYPSWAPQNRENLTIEQVVNTGLLGYPKGNPVSVYIEAPIRWILWRMGIISEPRYISDLAEPVEPGVFEKLIPGRMAKYEKELSKWKEEVGNRAIKFLNCEDMD